MECGRDLEVLHGGCKKSGLKIMDIILFVCIENSCRSQMAEGFYNSLSNSEDVAISAGANPAKEVNPNAITVMKEVGVDISSYRPKFLSDELIADADRIFTMGCYDACPANLPREKTVDWQIEDPSGKSIEKFRKVRDIIKKKVEELINEMFINDR